jgi:hypothetical protein
MMNAQGRHTLRTLLLLSLVCIGASVVAFTQADPSDADLMAAMDAQRFFGPSVNSIRVRIDSEKPDETRTAELRLHFAEIDNESYTRIEFLAPEEMAGQIYLSTPDGTYFLTPDLDSPIKTSATAEVFGDSAVAQTSGIRFDGNYTIADRRTVTLDDGRVLLEVDLAAVDYTVPFQAATVRVDPVTFRPESTVLYAVSGIPFYDVYYEEYATYGESDVYVTTQRIVNRLLVGRQTVSQILEIGAEDLPLTWFDPGSLAP